MGDKRITSGPVQRVVIDTSGGGSMRRHITGGPIQRVHVESEEAINGQVLTADGNGGVEWRDAAASAVGVTDVTYEELVTLIGAGSLTPGAFYRITDFATTHYIVDVDETQYLIDDGVVVGPNEPLVVLATDPYSIAPDAYSEMYPYDRITYDWNPNNWLETWSFADFSGDAPVIIPGFTGVILFRHDMLADNYAPGDWRHCKTRRWKLNVPAWDAETTYEIGEYVLGSDGMVYLALHGSTGEDPIISGMVPWAGILYSTASDYWSASPSTAPGDIPVGTEYHDFTLYEGAEGDASLYYNNHWDGELRTRGQALPNNVARGESFNNNVIGSGRFNTIGGINGSTGNVIGPEFSGNIIADNFTYNHIDSNFSYNLIGIGFSSNVIKAWFTGNVVGLNFDYNTIGLLFTDNMVGNVFTRNVIGSGFSMNDTGNEFTWNEIGDSFVENVIVSDFKGNKIGKDSHGNVIGIGFMDNVVGTGFADNVIDEDFFSNTIGTIFDWNTTGKSFGFNVIGPNFASNTVSPQFMLNVIGPACESNTIGESFSCNTVGSAFTENTVGDDFHNNTIGPAFSGNVVGNNFANNTVGGEINGNTVVDGFIANNVRDNAMASMDMSTATHVYGNYSCDILKDVGGTARLIYFDATGAQQIVLATA